MIASLLLFAAITVPDVSAVVGPPHQSPLAGAELSEHTDALARSIRCPVCQGSSVGDSPSEMARNMKRQVGELLALGFDDEQIIQYFEASYGEFIRLEPRKEGMNLIVWAAPIGALFLGFLLLALRFRGAETKRLEHLPSADELPADAELAAWVLKAREQIYSWPNGRSSKEPS
ncbi:MAG: cytochrome c-type biogenesis protein CcmH [Myxococcota bacterium]|nr:cytochrome c-type biogenesis protein CcmH [Myxococcota bacterium]